MAKPGYNQSNSTHHASAMQAHRGGSFFIKPNRQQVMPFELHSITCNQTVSVKFKWVLKFSLCK
jgi:hypothetical protein